MFPAVAVVEFNAFKFPAAVLVPDPLILRVEYVSVSLTV
jgi:hypothetical protein